MLLEDLLHSWNKTLQTNETSLTFISICEKKGKQTKKCQVLHVTFCLSIMMVQGYVLSMPRSLFNVSRNHFQLSMDIIPIAIGKMHSLGSMPTALNICPPNLVLMWQPSKHMRGLHADMKPLLQASRDM